VHIEEVEKWNLDSDNWNCPIILLPLSDNEEHMKNIYGDKINSVLLNETGKPPRKVKNLNRKLELDSQIFKIPDEYFQNIEKVKKNK